MAGRRRLGSILMRDHRVPPESIAAALHAQRAITAPRQTQDRIGRILRRMGAIGEMDLVTALAQQLELPVALDLSRLDLPEAVLALVPAAWAEKRLLVPMERIEEPPGLLLAMADPLDLASIGKLEKATCLRIYPAVAAEEEIRRALKVFYSPGGRALQDPAEYSISIENIRRRHHTKSASVPEEAPLDDQTTQ